MAAVSVWAGIGIRRPDPGICLVVGILSGIGLLNPPVGTPINGYILYLVFGAKGKVVFSDDYARARALSPDLQYRTPLLVKLCAALLLLTVVAGVVTALMAP